jgi:hypothetical protein
MGDPVPPGEEEWGVATRRAEPGVWYGAVAGSPSCTTQKKHMSGGRGGRYQREFVLALGMAVGGCGVAERETAR